MSNDDSFNDSDEMFSLYSKKKVTDTFRAHLKKIAANNYADALSRVNQVCNQDEENANRQVPVYFGKEKVIPVVEKRNGSAAVVEDESPNVSVEFSDHSLEDSIEIIAEVIGKRTIRQSKRLREKRGQPTPTPNYSRRNNSSIRANKQPTRGRSTRSKGKKQQKGKQIDEITLDDSSKDMETDDDLNPELSVKVIWKSVNLKKFQLRKFQKLSCIFQQLAEDENIPEDKIILTFNNVRVSHNDTPDSLNLQVYHFLDGGVLSELSNLCETPKSQNSKCDDDSVMIKFQDANKKIIKIVLNKNEKLKIGMIKCSEQLEIPLDKIRFFFDGELVEPLETPESLGLENEEVIDFKITS